MPQRPARSTPPRGRWSQLDRGPSRCRSRRSRAGWQAPRVRLGFRVCRWSSSLLLGDIEVTRYVTLGAFVVAAGGAQSIGDFGQIRFEVLDAVGPVREKSVDRAFQLRVLRRSRRV